jgi:hypothetical protein
VDRESRLRGQCLVSNRFGSVLQNFRIVFYNSSAPTANNTAASATAEPSEGSGWHETSLSSLLVMDQQEHHLADTWDLEEGDVEEFQMEMITELRKEEERKERKRIRERDKVRRNLWYDMMTTVREELIMKIPKTRLGLILRAR